MASVDSIKTTRDIWDLIGENNELPDISEFTEDKLSQLQWNKPPITSSDFAVKETSKFYDDLSSGNLQATDIGTTMLKTLKGKTKEKIKEYFEKGRDNIELTSASNQCWALQRVFEKNGFEDFYKGILKDSVNTPQLLKEIKLLGKGKILIPNNPPKKGDDRRGAAYDGNHDECWLCKEDISENGGTNDQCFTGSQCEHILPAGTIQSIFVLPIVKYNAKINKALKKLGYTKQEIKDYLVLRTTLLLSLFDWAHPYCNQLKGDKPLVMPYLDTTNNIKMRVEVNNVKKMAYEIVMSQNGTSNRPRFTDGVGGQYACNGDGFKRKWFLPTDDEGIKQEIYEIHNIIHTRCRNISKLFNSVDTSGIWMCVKVSILTTQEQIKERLNRKWTPGKGFLKKIIDKLGKMGGGRRGEKVSFKYPSVIRPVGIDDIERGARYVNRSYDKKILEIINDTYLYKEILEKYFENLEGFLIWLVGLGRRIELITNEINSFNLKEESRELIIPKLKEFLDSLNEKLQGDNRDFTYLMLLSIDETFMNLFNSMIHLVDMNERTWLIPDSDGMCIDVDSLEAAEAAAVERAVVSVEEAVKASEATAAAYRRLREESPYSPRPESAASSIFSDPSEPIYSGEILPVGYKPVQSGFLPFDRPVLSIDGDRAMSPRGRKGRKYVKSDERQRSRSGSVGDSPQSPLGSLSGLQSPLGSLSGLQSPLGSLSGLQPVYGGVGWSKNKRRYKRTKRTKRTKRNNKRNNKRSNKRNNKRSKRRSKRKSS